MRKRYILYRFADFASQLPTHTNPRVILVSTICLFFHINPDDLYPLTSIENSASLGGVFLYQSLASLELWQDRLQAQTHSDGLKKVDGRQLYQVHYEPSKRTEAQILLYFRSGDIRHVKTVYSTVGRKQQWALTSP